MFAIWRDARIAPGSPGVSTSLAVAGSAAACSLGLDRLPVGRFGSDVIHIPEKSGLPSVRRGAGAVMLTVPSALCGTPAVGYLIHCAGTAADVPEIASAARSRVVSRMSMRRSI